MLKKVYEVFSAIDAFTKWGVDMGNFLGRGGNFSRCLKIKTFRKSYIWKLERYAVAEADLGMFYEGGFSIFHNIFMYECKVLKVKADKYKSNTS